MFRISSADKDAKPIFMSIFSLDLNEKPLLKKYPKETYKIISIVAITEAAIVLFDIYNIFATTSKEFLIKLEDDS